MRRAFSLIELLVVITGSSVVFTVLTVSLYALSGAQRAAQDGFRETATVHNFAQQLRLDAHKAIECRIDEGSDAADERPKSTTLTLTLNENQYILYKCNPVTGELRRRVREGERTVKEDRFAFAPGSHLGWETREEGGTPILTALVVRSEGSQSVGRPGRRTYRIEAAIGLNRTGALK